MLLDFLKKYLSIKPKQIPEQASEAPYKVEAPTSAQAVKPPVSCGCGRSPSGLCEGYHALTAEQWAASDKNSNRVAETVVKEVAPAKPAPAKKKPAAKKAPAKPPAEKKPRAPRKPKASA